MTRREVDVAGGVDTLTEPAIKHIFNIILEGIAKFDTEQYRGYAALDTAGKLDVIREVYYEECYIYYKISSKRRAYDVVQAVMGTDYEPFEGKFKFTDESGEVSIDSVNEVMIAPQYIMLLAKTPDNYLVCSSAKTNHYDIPVSAGTAVRQTMPYRNSPVKILSETESRLYTGYAERTAIAELKDRANSVETHTMLYRALLDAETPCNVDQLINRELHPYGTDKALETVDAMLGVSGIELEYCDDNSTK